MIVPNDVLLGEISALLEEGKEVELRCKGNSMLPFIVGERDSVRLVKSGFSVGDAVLAELAPGHYVLHRIVAIEGDCVTLKGDGNLAGVEHCRLEDVRGKAVAVVTPDGKLHDFACEKSVQRARRWNSLPYFVRRVYLAVYRRLVNKR